VFQLAELLHKSVTEIRALPVSELYGWLAYFEDRHNRDSGNLLAGGEDELIAKLT